MSLTSLPDELILEILSHACPSQEVYHSLLLISWRFHRLVEFTTLLHVPIRITKRNARSFSEQLTKTPELSKHVHYLWISSLEELAESHQIAPACINLIALACSKSVFFSLCSSSSPGGFLHRQLTELFISDSWQCWRQLSELPGTHVLDFCHQIQRLRIHDYLSSDLYANAGLFPSLTHFSTTPEFDEARRILKILAALPKLEHIVMSACCWSEDMVEKLLARDKRLRILVFALMQTEYELWCGRARNRQCIWSLQMGEEYIADENEGNTVEKHFRLLFVI
ncbi:hypothetical protein B0H34DRAFT_797913 [Crassisporium funariophilum]|nr:hypothetical protein B0H34DRAFT_797913 [Crassisporium funariophilum]